MVVVKVREAGSEVTRVPRIEVELKVWVMFTGVRLLLLIESAGFLYNYIVGCF